MSLEEKLAATRAGSAARIPPRTFRSDTTNGRGRRAPHHTHTRHIIHPAHTRQTQLHHPPHLPPPTHNRHHTYTHIPTARNRHVPTYDI